MYVMSRQIMVLSWLNCLWLHTATLSYPPVMESSYLGGGWGGARRDWDQNKWCVCVCVKASRESHNQVVQGTYPGPSRDQVTEQEK